MERTDEALATDSDIISTACPFCITMLSDAVTAKKQSGEAREEIEVLDVSQILARSLKAKEPALVGAPAVPQEVTTEAPAPIGATPAETAAVDEVQLGQNDAAGSGSASGPAGSGAAGSGSAGPGSAGPGSAGSAVTSSQTPTAPGDDDAPASPPA